MGTFELFTGSPAELPAGDAVVVQAWSGNVHPYRATAYRNGRVVGRTGFCATEARAVARAEEFLAAPPAELPAAPAQPRWRWYIDMAVGEGCQATALDGSPCSMDSVEEVAIGGSAYYLCSRHAKQVRVAPTPPEVRNPDPEETEADI